MIVTIMTRQPATQRKQCHHGVLSAMKNQIVDGMSAVSSAIITPTSQFANCDFNCVFKYLASYPFRLVRR